MNTVLADTIQHYLNSPHDSKLLDHRLAEILLLLAEKNMNIMNYALNQERWSQRVRTILSSDLIHEWNIADVSERLATSETTLRRKLRAEDTGFREILYELRLTHGLMCLLQTTLPVYQISYDCGYQSVSRFSSNFRKRFGLTPTELRASVTGMDEKEQDMAVSGQPQSS